MANFSLLSKGMLSAGLEKLFDWLYSFVNLEIDLISSFFLFDVWCVGCLD